MKNPKILYVSCHSILEYDELRMFKENGWKVFSIGAYLHPTQPQVNSRPSLDGVQPVPRAMDVYLDMCDKNRSIGIPPELRSRTFTSEFLDCFDVIIVMHIPSWILDNWSVLKGRNVVWRTIGQSIPNVELSLKTCRDEGLKVVRYSPVERTISNFIGEDALIRFGKYKEDFKEWTGEIKRVITIGQSMKVRGWNCNYDIFREATRGIPTKLYGIGNDDVEDEIKGGQIQSYSELVDILSKNAVYFYTGTRPASYTLNFMEASFAGIPMVSIGEKSTVFEDHNYFEVASLLKKYCAEFVSDDPTQLRGYIETLMNNQDLACFSSHQLRRMAIDLFDAEKIKHHWGEFIGGI